MSDFCGANSRGYVWCSCVQNTGKIGIAMVDPLSPKEGYDKDL